MKKAFFYLVLIGITYFILMFLFSTEKIILSNRLTQQTLYCGIFGGFGGITYCLRGIYLNACVHKNWDKEWLPWYFIRPIVSFICGVMSYIFFRTGLVIFEANLTKESTYFTFYAFAFISGLNVDKFVEKIEDIAKITFGINKSRTASKNETDNSTKNKP